jgi:hypothetical protein
MWAMWSLVSVRLETVFVSAHKSIWTYLMELLGDMGHVESRFSPFRGIVSVCAK